MEYKWTSAEIKQTTNNITAVKPSKQKPQFTVNNSQLTQLVNIKWHDELQIAVSKTIKIAIKAANIIAVVDKIHDPAIPIKRPKKKHEIKLKNGKIKLYIQFKN